MVIGTNTYRSISVILVYIEDKNCIYGKNDPYIHSDAEYGAQPKLPRMRVYLTPIKFTTRALEIQNRPMIANTILRM